MAARRAATRKPPRSHRRQPRPSPRPANRDTRAAGTAPATVQVRTQRPSGALAEEPDEYDPHHLPTEQRTTRRETATRTPDSQRRQLHHLRPSSDLTLSYETRGSSQYSVETPRPGGQTERAPREIAGPRRLGPAAQHWTAYVWMRQHLRGIRSAPKAVLAHAAPARGIVHVSRRVLPNGCF